MVGGYLSDRFGRRRSILVLSAVHIIASFATYLSHLTNSYTVFLLTRFLVGGSIHMVWSAFFVLATEVSIENRRGYTGAIVGMGMN